MRKALYGLVLGLAACKPTPASTLTIPIEAIHEVEPKENGCYTDLESELDTRILVMQIENKEGSEYSAVAGHGFLYDTNTILTARHIVDEAKSKGVLTTRDLDGNMLDYKYSAIQMHPKKDIALITIEPQQEYDPLEVQPAEVGLALGLRRSLMFGQERGLAQEYLAMNSNLVMYMLDATMTEGGRVISSEEDRATYNSEEDREKKENMTVASSYKTDIPIVIGVSGAPVFSYSDQCITLSGVVSTMKPEQKISFEDGSSVILGNASITSASYIEDLL